MGEALVRTLGIIAVPSIAGNSQPCSGRTGPVVAINGANELINLGGGLGVRFASLFAPVALVSAVSSTTTLVRVRLWNPAHDLLSAIRAAKICPGATSSRKARARALAAIGVALINLAGR